jgi:PAS domain S-box-containing protein
MQHVPSSAGATHRQTAIYENILVNMADGVISLDLQGNIMTFNPAAGRMLALAPDELVGRTYAELFFEDPGYDGLNELVLKAIYEAETTHSEEIEVQIAAETRNLLVSTTFLGGGSAGGKLGIIVVISDVTEQRKRKKVKRLFGEYLDPRIVDGILNGELETSGIRQTMTVSFCDLEGFTGLGEVMDASALIEFVNLYLAVMLPPIGRHGGVTDKYIGDAIMAFWGPPFTRGADPAVEACHAALEQRAALAELRRRVRDELGAAIDAERLDMRCGIATGEVVAGSIGPPQSRNYTVIGDRVNLASRLEGANKALGSRILVCEETRRRAQGDFLFRELDTIQVRGRVRRERVFELVARSEHRTGGARQTGYRPTPAIAR